MALKLHGFDDSESPPDVLVTPNAKGITISGTLTPGSVYYGRLINAVKFSDWYLTSISGASGSISLDVWAHATNKPTVSDSIIDTGTNPSISSDWESDGNTGDWATTELSAGSRIAVKIDSLSGISEIYFSLVG